MSFKIGFLERDQIEKVLQFFNNAMSDKTRSVFRSNQEFEWLFIDGPLKSSLYAIAEDERTKEIVGTNAGIYIPMLSGSGEKILTCKSEDSLISLDLTIQYGKRDVLKEILTVLEENYKIDNVSFVWGFTKSKNSFKRCGYSINSQIKGSFYVISPVQFYTCRTMQMPHQTFTKKLKLFGFAWYGCIRQQILSSSSVLSGIRLVGINEIDEDKLSDFLPGNVCTIDLTREFLNWRISRNPSHMIYEILEFRDNDGQVISYFIYSFNRGNVYFVEQFLFSNKLSDKERIRIMKNAFRFIKKRKPPMIRYSGFSDNEVNIKEMDMMKKAGFCFIENKTASYFILKNINNASITAKDIYLSRLNTLGTV